MPQRVPALKQHKLILREFWENFGKPNKGGGWGRKIPSPAGKDLVIAELQRLGGVELHYRSKHGRKDFNSKKRYKKYQFHQCFACGELAEVRHHIIWLSHGGRNQANNVIGLCRRCHSKIHPWLES